MFPPAGASVYYNEAGEPLGYDLPGEPEYDPDHYVPDYGDGDEPDEPDGMHDYERGDVTHRMYSDPDCRICGQRPDDKKHW
jgi:hypothetical protein